MATLTTSSNKFNKIHKNLTFMAKRMTVLSLTSYWLVLVVTRLDQATWQSHTHTLSVFQCVHSVTWSCVPLPWLLFYVEQTLVLLVLFCFRLLILFWVGRLIPLYVDLFILFCISLLMCFCAGLLFLFCVGLLILFYVELLILFYVELLILRYVGQLFLLFCS